MEQSLFIQWVKKYFPGIVVRVTNTLNDSTNQPVYLHRTMLKEEFSVTGKWESISVANSLVMADVVAMDSTLPLKKRDTISKASGDIPKMGMTLKLNERQLTDLDTLIAQGGTEPQIIAKLFADTPKAVGGVYERNEAIFLEGLSTGVTVVDDTETVGTGIRLDYGYVSANTFGVSVLWSNPSTATPVDDIDRALEKARLDGNTPTVIMMDKYAFNNAVKTTQVKEQFAFSLGYTGDKLQSPNSTQFTTFLSDKWGLRLVIVDRSVRHERNGVQTAVKPWAEGAVVLLPSETVGSLIYAKLAEEAHPVAGVEYQKANNYILVSKYRKNDPLSEYTSSQARVVPVIANVDQIYRIDSKSVQA